MLNLPPGGLPTGLNRPGTRYVLVAGADDPIASAGTSARPTEPERGPSVFDTIAGLPLHPLVVHAVVVLLPLMSLVTIAVAARPAWRPAAVWVVVADVLVLGCAFVAKESGEKFQGRLSNLRGGAAVAKQHADQGALLPWFALALLVAAVVVLLARRRPVLAVPAVALAVLAGLAAITWTVVVGHSGAVDVWSGVVSSGAAG